ncbi:protein-L-isoaspartate(D-aspartate) O-methyltransferase [Cytophagaceae bacterium ABcell3]|nr:protein-L-isoaspartate(D-aspartate) O-methyltransferase [Cytophagaceae bacterium ABcell3]
MRTTKADMIQFQLKDRGITDPAVLKAMGSVDRSLFVPDDMQDLAYEDGPLPIGHEQTISQPYIVAYMAQELKLNPEDKVLEIGSGCGYNAAILSQIVSEVYSIEIVDWLADLAKENLQKAGISNVYLQHKDGFEGWPEKAPFDAIVLTAAPPEIPEPLKKQLKVGGKILAPVGEEVQYLNFWEKIGDHKFSKHKLLPVRFVPMTGEAQR